MRFSRKKSIMEYRASSARTGATASTRTCINMPGWTESVEIHRPVSTSTNAVMKLMKAMVLTMSRRILMIDIWCSLSSLSTGYPAFSSPNPLKKCNRTSQYCARALLSLDVKKSQATNIRDATHSTPDNTATSFSQTGISPMKDPASDGISPS